MHRTWSSYLLQPFCFVIVISNRDSYLFEMMTVHNSLTPWLTVQKTSEAIDFYKSAFGAREVYRMEGTDEDLVVRLSIDGAEFWVSNGTPSNPLGGENIKMILTVPDPDILFLQAVKAGALEIFPVGEDHGWRLGRLSDPFGLHWEIGRPLGEIRYT